MQNNNQELLANDIYDLIKEAFLPDKQADDWSMLSKQHAKEARQRLKKMHSKKHIAISGNKITIGKNLTITITH